MSKELLTRPWCIGELVTAHINGVAMAPVVFPDFQTPDEEFIENYHKHVDINCLSPHGISLEMVQKMLRWLISLPTLDLPQQLSNMVVQSVAEKLVRKEFGGPLSQGKSMRLEASSVAVVVDHTNLESACCGLVLSKLLARHTVHDVAKVPYVVPSFDEVPAKGISTCIFVLSNGVFSQPDFIRAMMAAASQNARIIPIISEDGFRFPSKAMLEEIRSTAPEFLGRNKIELDPDSLVFLIQDMFKEIAIVFAPQDYSSTEDLLATKAADCADRLLNGKLQRLTIRRSEKTVEDAAALTEDLTEDAFQPAANVVNESI
mmetsp:Transcript_92658/g.281348  ORF Transcript_92658/g.281348 Transcript_92658/m.281348 type:complete len:317 (-) Transcript_92658:36-986(-)